LNFCLDEASETNGKSSETRTKWKAVAKKSRYATKSIGDYFSQSKSLLSFRRSSLVPKSPTGLVPVEMAPHHAQTTICISSPDYEAPTEHETSPSIDESPTSPLPPEDPAKIKFVVGEDTGKKRDSYTLRPG